MRAKLVRTTLELTYICISSAAASELLRTTVILLRCTHGFREMVVNMLRLSLEPIAIETTRKVTILIEWRQC